MVLGHYPCNIACQQIGCVSDRNGPAPSCFDSGGVSTAYAKATISNATGDLTAAEGAWFLFPTTCTSSVLCSMYRGGYKGNGSYYNDAIPKASPTSKRCLYKLTAAVGRNLGGGLSPPDPNIPNGPYWSVSISEWDGDSSSYSGSLWRVVSSGYGERSDSNCLIEGVQTLVQISGEAGTADVLMEHVCDFNECFSCLEGTTPETVSLEISGVSWPCESLNGTHILARADGVPRLGAPTCNTLPNDQFSKSCGFCKHFETTFPDHPCGGDYYRVKMDFLRARPSDFGYDLLVTLQASYLNPGFDGPTESGYTQWKFCADPGDLPPGQIVVPAAAYPQVDCSQLNFSGPFSQGGSASYYYTYGFDDCISNVFDSASWTITS